MKLEIGRFFKSVYFDKSITMTLKELEICLKKFPFFN